MKDEPKYKVTLDGKAIDMTFDPGEIDALSEDLNVFRTTFEPLIFKTAVQNLGLQQGKCYTKVTSFLGMPSTINTRTQLSESIKILEDMLYDIIKSLSKKYTEKQNTIVQFVYAPNTINIEDADGFLVFNFTQILFTSPTLGSRTTKEINAVKFIIADNDSVEKIYADLYVAITAKIDEVINVRF